MKKRRTSEASDGDVGTGIAGTGQNMSCTRRSTSSSCSLIAAVDDMEKRSETEGILQSSWSLQALARISLHSEGDSLRTSASLCLSRALAIRHIVSTPSFLASSHSKGDSLRTNAAYPVDSHLDISYWTPSTIWSTGSIRGWKVVISSIARVRSLAISKRDDIDRIDFHDSRDGLKVLFILECRMWDMDKRNIMWQHTPHRSNREDSRIQTWWLRGGWLDRVLSLSGICLTPCPRNGAVLGKDNLRPGMRCIQCQISK